MITEIIDKKDRDRSAEIPKRNGKLLVFTGQSGAGKDTVVDAVLQHPEIKRRGITKIITHATREMRPGEINGVHYHFVSENHLREMGNRGELAEEPTLTGKTYKATSKDAVRKILGGDKIAWRIDISRTVEVVAGNLHNDVFSEDDREWAKENTHVFFISAPPDQLEKRRKERDGEQHNLDDYKRRDADEEKQIQTLMRYKGRLHIVENPNGGLDVAVNK